MLDLLYLFLAILFFALSFALIYALDHLREG